MKFGAKERLANYTKYTEKSFLPLTLAHILRWHTLGSYVSPRAAVAEQNLPAPSVITDTCDLERTTSKKVIKMNRIL